MKLDIIKEEAVDTVRILHKGSDTRKPHAGIDIISLREQKTDVGIWVISEGKRK